MKNCKIEKSQEGFRVQGLINFDTVMNLYKKGTELFESCDEIRLDFSEVVHADSSAIALLLDWLRFGKKNNKSLVFVNLPGQLLEMANVCEVIPILNKYITFNQ